MNLYVIKKQKKLFLHFYIFYNILKIKYEIAVKLKKNQLIYFSTIASAQRSPSMAAETIPPA